MKTTDVTINNPCNEDWDAMNGGRKRRHCGSCDKDVFHLSQMTRREATHLLETRDASICVRYRYDDQGNIEFRDSTLGGRLELQWEGVRKLVAAAAIVLPGFALTACDTGQTMGQMEAVHAQPSGTNHGYNRGEPRPVTVTIIDGQPALTVTPEAHVEPAEPVVKPIERPHVRMGRRAPPVKRLMGKVERRFEMMGDVAGPE